MEENVDCYMSEASINMCTDRLTSIIRTNQQTDMYIYTTLTDTLCADELTNIIHVQLLIQALC